VFQYLISSHEHLSEPEERKKGARRSFKREERRVYKAAKRGKWASTVKGFDILGFDKTAIAGSVRQGEREPGEGGRNQDREEGKWWRKGKTGEASGGNWRDRRNDWEEKEFNAGDREIMRSGGRVIAKGQFWGRRERERNQMEHREREKNKWRERGMLMIFCGTPAWRLVWCGHRCDESFPEGN
jgi:hypothetical protein